MGSSHVPDDFESAQRLTYAGAVANETMRLRPVAPMLFLQTNIATTVGDLQVPAQTPVAVLMRPPAVDARNFERPTAFLPERWTAPSGAHEPSAHIPFGSGPRLCPGRTLALLEMKVVLATLYRNFDVERDGAASGRPRAVLVHHVAGRTPCTTSCSTPLNDGRRLRRPFSGEGRNRARRRFLSSLRRVREPRVERRWIVQWWAQI